MNYNNKDIRIVFGSGKVVVTSVTTNTLMFKQLKHYAKVYQVGEQITNANTIQGIDNQYTLTFNDVGEINEFKKFLTNAYEHSVFKFKNITFDFSTYNRKSIDCIVDQLNWMEKFMPSISAV